MFLGLYCPRPLYITFQAADQFFLAESQKIIHPPIPSAHFSVHSSSSLPLISQSWNLPIHSPIQLNNSNIIRLPMFLLWSLKLKLTCRQLMFPSLPTWHRSNLTRGTHHPMTIPAPQLITPRWASSMPRSTSMKAVNMMRFLAAARGSPPSRRSTIWILQTPPASRDFPQLHPLLGMAQDIGPAR